MEDHAVPHLPPSGEPPPGTPRTSQASLGRQLRRLLSPPPSSPRRLRSTPLPRFDPAQRRALGATGLDHILHWFASRHWTPWPFQLEAWNALRAGRSGLVQVPTGAGKTYAAFLGALSCLIDELLTGAVSPGPRILYITPLRAVSRDIELALRAPIAGLALPLVVESRTGDTSASIRARQRERLPHVLITTPESLSLLLTRENAAALFAPLHSVIIDEWHELISSKRGTQTELALARLRRFAPSLRTWALSATLPNLDAAALAACGLPNESHLAPAPPVIVRGAADRPIFIDTLLPRPGEPFPWAGHLGLTMLPRVLENLDPARSTLIFTNTRSQAELWHQAILQARPEWDPILALHHGSLDRDERSRVEAGVKSGALRFVVATSSLDLGVDFAPVERVIQISSVKGIARLIQRAGRASHRPGQPCSITCVPTHGLELIEIDAARRAVADSAVEPRLPLPKPLDVLAQHLVTVALGGGFTADELFAEVSTALAFSTLTRAEFDWSLDLVCQGGVTLRAYPQYHKVQAENGRYVAKSPLTARLHRLNVGTIVGEGVVEIRYLRGRRIGTIEEAFVGRLRPGEKFLFAGKLLSFVDIRDMVALVKPASGKTNYTPHWAGTKLPISESLSAGVRASLERAASGLFDSPELAAARPLLSAQTALSRIPSADELLIELTPTREGLHCFFYPFEGRGVHGGLSALVALRLSRLHPATFTIAVNDYGFELLTHDHFPFESLLSQLGPDLYSPHNLTADALASVNMSSLARLHFREIARVAGLVMSSYPGNRKSGRQLQASAGLIYDVFREFDPDNLLLHQATREVLERQFEESRLARCLDRLSHCRRTLVYTRKPTPLGFPLILERVAAEMTGESLAQRIERMRESWVQAAESAPSLPTLPNPPSPPPTTPPPRPSRSRRAPRS